MLRAGRVDPTTQLEQARFVPFRRVGHDVVEKIIEAFRLDIPSKRCCISHHRTTDFQNGGDVDDVRVRETEERRLAP